jgi:ATP-dependent DNA helicase RecG
VYEWVAKKVKGGEQAYVVVPAIDGEMGAEEELELAEEDGAMAKMEEGTREVAIENRKLKIENLKSAVEVQRELQGGWLKECRVGMMHGRMGRETRQHIMERFRQGLMDVLVATTVIEVGVDVANATMMVVENADRFGLSQLHQLRGRVGRGSKQSYCVLLGDLTGDDGIARLQAMVKHASGFLIAEADLKLRGMGQLIGTAQSGRTDFHFAELLFDPVLLPLSRRDAFQVVAADPRLLDAGHAKLRGAVLGRFKDTITLADVG